MRAAEAVLAAQTGRAAEAVRAAADSLVSPERLASFFAPRSIAVVGASDASGWARFVLAAASATGFTGPLIPVHPKHQTVFGRPAVPSLRDLAEPVDLAFIMAPAEAVESVLDDAGAAGVRGAIVLASGYREVGGDGSALQAQLAARAAANGITLLGPNCLGFLNAHEKAGPFALTVPLPLAAGPVGIAMQSGALASVVLAFARARAIGVSTLTTLGNEAMITAADVLDYLITDERTKVICLFLEQIGDAGRFARAALAAERASKPIVVLKAGSSTAGSEAALAHTGSVAGDDAVVDAALRQLNVIRVHSIEELLCTGGLLGYSRRPRGRRMGVLTSSGGACDLIADRAAGQGLELPAFASSTVAAITPHLPSFASARNPMDATGYFLANRRTSALTTVDNALDAVVDDPGLDFVLFSGLALPDSRPPDEVAATLLEDRVAWLGQRMASSPIPVITVGSTCVDITPFGRDLLGRNGIHMVGGIDHGVQAIGNAIRWAQGRERLAARTAAESAVSAAPASKRAERIWAEAEARGLLARFGVPVVPAELARSGDGAVAAAKRLGYPVVLRVSSALIAHKSDIGGVALGLESAAQVRAAYRRVRAAGLASADRIDGVMVSRMRTGGIELLAGITVDPVFGPVLAVGLGGVWVEVLADVSLRVLPASQGEIVAMLGELRAAPLLRGARGTVPADLDAIASVIGRLGDAALSLNGSLRSLEVNPLWVRGDQIEALDVLISTTEQD